MIRTILTVGLLASMLSASITLWIDRPWLAIASFVSMALFASAFGYTSNRTEEHESPPETGPGEV